MKYYTLILYILLASAYSLSAQIHSAVDERMELQSIVFRLAGAQEFVNNDFKEYADAVDKYFGKYSDHEIVRFIQEIRTRKNIAYSLIPVSTPMLAIKDGGVISVKENSYEAAEEVWGEEWDRYVRLLDDFYRKSRFNRFFCSQSETYRKAMEDMDKMLSRIDTSWFYGTFGYYLEPRVYLCMANGQHNYSFTDSTANGGYGIALGYSPMFFDYNVIIHEIAHRYTAMSDDYYPQVENAMTRIFENGWLVERYRQNAYPHKSAVFNEWLTELVVIMYKMAKETAGGSRQGVLNAINCAEGMGYLWMSRSVEFVDNFYSDRDTYPYFQDFMPRLCEFLQYTTRSDNWVKVLKESDKPHPYVKNVYPVNGSNLAEYKNLKAVRIQFSEPMNNHCMGFIGLYPSEPEDRLFDIESSYWEDDRTFVVPVNADNLDKSDYFKLVLNKKFMVSSLKMMMMATDYEIEYFVEE